MFHGRVITAKPELQNRDPCGLEAKPRPSGGMEYRPTGCRHSRGFGNAPNLACPVRARFCQSRISLSFSGGEKIPVQLSSRLRRAGGADARAVVSHLRHIEPLAWIGPGCLLLAGLGANGRHAFAFGYLGGLVHHLVSLHWLLHIPFPAGAVAGWLALSGYLALYPAAWVWLCTTALIRSRAHLETTVESPGRGAESARLPGARHDTRAAGRSDLASANALVPGMRWRVGGSRDGCGPVRFPVELPGRSQHQTLPLIQIASGHGRPRRVLHRRLVFRRAALRQCLCGAAHRPPSPIASPSPMVAFRVTLASDLALPLLAVVAITGYGGSRLVTPQQAESELRVAVVQPSIPQRLSFSIRGNQQIVSIESWS